MTTVTPGHALAEIVVDLDAVDHNIRTLAEVVAPARVMAVVKADGYNHGALDVARTALAAGAAELGLATLGEALALRTGLRDAGAPDDEAPLTAWMWLADPEIEDLAAAVEYRVTLGIPSLAHLRAAVAAARAAGGVAEVGLMVDTGLSRSGVSPDEWPTVLDEAVAAVDAGLLDVRGLFSHFASADDPASPVTDLQEERFSDRIGECRSRGLDVPVNHIANTPAALSRVDLRHEMVRPGVGIYGVDPCAIPSGVELRPAMTVRARVVTTRVVRKGEGVSYGHHWVAERDTRTAVVAVGYADGIPRSISGRFGVTVDGTWYPQIGSVCMDQIVVELGPADEETPVRPGDWAVVFGEGGTSVDEFAEIAGTIPYEVLTMPRCRLARRVLPVRR